MSSPVLLSSWPKSLQKKKETPTLLTFSVDGWEILKGNFDHVWWRLTGSTGSIPLLLAFIVPLLKFARSLNSLCGNLEILMPGENQEKRNRELTASELRKCAKPTSFLLGVVEHFLNAPQLDSKIATVNRIQHPLQVVQSLRRKWCSTMLYFVALRIFFTNDRTHQKCYRNNTLSLDFRIFRSQANLCVRVIMFMFLLSASKPLPCALYRLFGRVGRWTVSIRLSTQSLSFEIGLEVTGATGITHKGSNDAGCNLLVGLWLAMDLLSTHFSGSIFTVGCFTPRTEKKCDSALRTERCYTLWDEDPEFDYIQRKFLLRTHFSFGIVMMAWSKKRNSFGRWNWMRDGQAPKEWTAFQVFAPWAF